MKLSISRIRNRNSTKLFVAILTPIFLMTGTGCLKIVSVPTTSLVEIANSHSNIIYVCLKPGVDYMGRHVLTVKDPKIEDEYLIGSTIRKKEIKIRLDKIDSIDVVKIDKKKVVRNSIIFTVVMVPLMLYGYAYGRALEGLD